MQTPEKTILLVDDDQELLEGLRVRCQQLGLQVLTAQTATSALEQARQQRPDLICLDIAMPGGNGLTAGQMLAIDDDLKSIPVVMVSGCDDEKIIQQCRSLKARYVTKGTDLWQRLKPVLRELLGVRDHDAVESSPDEAAGKPVTFEDQPESTAVDMIDRVFELLGAAEDAERLDPANEADSEQSATWSQSPPWVLCIEDDEDFSLALKLKFEQHGVAVVRATEGADGFQQAISRPADAIILDFNLPNGRGDYVLRRLKRNPVTRDIPVFVVTGVRDQKLEREMLRLGADGFFTKPLDFRQLRDELKKHIDILVSV